MLPPIHDHRPSQWEVNEIAKFFTKRCANCGEILERLTFDEAKRSSSLAIQGYLKGM